MKISSFALVAALLVAAAAQAQPPEPSPEMQAARAAMQKACAADTKTLCADKTGREVGMCLRSNADKLSADCKDAMAKMPRRPAPTGQ